MDCHAVDHASLQGTRSTSPRQSAVAFVAFRTVLVVIMDFYHLSESGKEDVKVHTDADFCEHSKGLDRYHRSQVIGRRIAGI